MVEIVDSEKSCPRCGTPIEASTVRCVSCGAEIVTETRETVLNAVDPEHRVQIAHFDLDQGEQAELACGMLRANGIACELSNPLLPGLPNERALWVNVENAEQARALLADAESQTSGEADNAA